MRRTISTIVVAAVLLLGAGAALAWWMKPDRPAATSPGPSVAVTPRLPQASTSPGDGSPGGTSLEPSESVPPYPSGAPAGQSAAAQRKWMPVAVGFGRHFTPVGSQKAKQWRQGLARYVTPELSKQLSSVDVRNVPDGSYVGSEAVEYGEDQVVVQVDYDAADAGWSLVLYISTSDDGASWQVNRYDRQELG